MHIDRDRHPVAFAGSARGPLQLFEGLPHQAWERTRFAEERGRADVIELGGWQFYGEPLPLAADEVAALTACAAAPDTFLEFGGEKRCGGFHPDFALAFGPALVLLCFGCGEALLVEGEGPRRVDVRSAEFQRVLGTKRRHRPPDDRVVHRPRSRRDA